MAYSGFHKGDQFSLAISAYTKGGLTIFLFFPMAKTDFFAKAGRIMAKCPPPLNTSLYVRETKKEFLQELLARKPLLAISEVGTKSRSFKIIRSELMSTLDSGTSRHMT